MSLLRSLALSVVGVLVLALPVGAQVAPTLQGEVLIGETHNSSVARACNPEGTSRVSFSVDDGTAEGPYPGIYDETATVDISPQTGPPILHPFLPSGPVEAFSARFRIDSPIGTVTGTKTLAPNMPNDGGLCVEFTENAFHEEQCRLAGDGGFVRARYFLFSAWVRYEAIIDSPTGRYRDTGLAYASWFEAEFECERSRQYSSGGKEYFVRSDGVVLAHTPGKATGGGQINHLPPQNGANVSFGFEVISPEAGSRTPINGHCSIVEHATNTRINCETITQYVQMGNEASFSGSARVNGEPTGIRIEVQDVTESGQGTDRFSYETDNGHSGSGLLTQGNIQVHPKALT